MDPVECAQARSKYKLKELPWRRAMAALQVPSRTLEVLLSKGYLEGNTTGEQLDFTITTDALIRFAREYVSMREMTHQLRFAYPQLAAKLRCEHIRLPPLGRSLMRISIGDLKSLSS